MMNQTRKSKRAAEPRPLTMAQAKRIGRGVVAVIADEDAPGNWWVMDAANRLRAGSYAPMTRAEFERFLAEWAR